MLLSGFLLIAKSVFIKKIRNTKGCVKYEGAGKSVFSLSEEFTNKTTGIYFLILLFCFVLFSFVFQPGDVEIGNRNDFLNRDTIGRGLLDSFR